MKITKSELKKIKKKAYESGYDDAGVYRCNVCYSRGYEKCKDDVKDALFNILADQDCQDDE